MKEETDIGVMLSATSAPLQFDKRGGTGGETLKTTQQAAIYWEDPS
jgi:hypothetical protein